MATIEPPSKRQKLAEVSLRQYYCNVLTVDFNFLCLLEPLFCVFTHSAISDSTWHCNLCSELLTRDRITILLAPFINIICFYMLLQIFFIYYSCHTHTRANITLSFSTLLSLHLQSQTTISKILKISIFSVKMPMGENLELKS